MREREYLSYSGISNEFYKQHFKSKLTALAIQKIVQLFRNIERYETSNRCPT